MRTLVAYCETHLRHRLVSVPVPAGDYLAALFAFLWDSGMRIGDAVSMEFPWIQTGTVTWRQSKTGVWHRAQLSTNTLAAIERIREPVRAMIWPRPAENRTALYRLIKSAILAAGLSGTSKYIRRGVATNVFLNGGDPGRALGHVPGSRVAHRHYVSVDAQLSPVSPTEL
jgi:integrase